MISFARHVVLAAFLSLCLLGGPTTSARAQSDHWISFSAPYVIYPVPLGGYLYGVSAVIDAQGRLMVKQQQAFLMREHVLKARIENERLKFDLQAYKRAHTLTPEQERELFRWEEVRRAQNNPPLTEVYSAKSLNDLLTDLQIIQALGPPAAAAPLSHAVLRKINVTPDRCGGHLGILKDERLRWPTLLCQPKFKNERDQLDRLLRDAFWQVSHGLGVDDFVAPLSGAIMELDRKLRSAARSVENKATWSAEEYIDAKRFLTHCDDAVRVLRKGDVRQVRQCRARGKTVAELVRYMTEHGLRFAPATTEDKAAYAALHRALADYDLLIRSQLDRRVLSAARPR
jgi:hypothetical protein